MRRFVLVCVALLSFLGAAGCRSAAQSPDSPPSAGGGDQSAFTGTVAETVNTGGYTYVRLQAAGKEDVWIAAPEFVTKVGDTLTVALEMPMTNFESKTLKRTFPLIYFVSNVSRDGQVVSGEPAAAAMPSPMAAHGQAAAPAKVERIAPPADGLSIEEVWKRRKELAGKEVTVRGQVVKLNNGILGKNWIHLQDGSGSEKDRTNDLTVTTDAMVQMGDVITVTGVLAIGKEIGEGYAYDAILENAKVRR